MPSGDTPAIAINLAGTHTDASGSKVTFTRADLASVVSSYSPAKDPAPLVIGWPNLGDPAYGWVAGLRQDGDTLVATTKLVQPAFAELVREKRYSKLLASLYRPDSDNNPKRGSWYLKHLAFDGITAPPIASIGTVAFGNSQGSRSAVTVAVELPRSTSCLPFACRSPGAQREALIASFAEQTDDPVAKRRVQEVVRAAQLQSQQPSLSFPEALYRARSELPSERATASFAEQTDDPVATRRMKAVVRASQLQAQQPSLSLSEALYRAHSALPSETFAASFAEQTDDPVAKRRVHAVLRATQLLGECPGLSFPEALDRARSEPIHSGKGL